MMYQSCKAKRLDDKLTHKCHMPLEGKNQNYRGPKYGNKDVDDGHVETITIRHVILQCEMQCLCDM